MVILEAGANQLLYKGEEESLRRKTCNTIFFTKPA